MLLVLFKPWTVLSELKEDNITWNDSYKSYLSELKLSKSSILKYIDNIGLLCKSKADAEEEKRSITSAKRLNNKI
jgi:hypothetical protein